MTIRSRITNSLPSTRKGRLGCLGTLTALLLVLLFILNWNTLNPQSASPTTSSFAAGLNSTPTAPTVVPTNAPAQFEITVINTANVRQDPSVCATKVAIAPKDAKITVIGKRLTGKNTWIEVYQADPQRAFWIYSGLTDISDNALASLPTVERDVQLCADDNTDLGSGDD